MKSALITVLALLAYAYAQSVKIAAPAANSHITTTENVVIEVERPNSQTPSRDVAVLIGLRSCPNGDCDSVADSSALGTILYGGAYSPIPRTGGGAMYENYTVLIPDSVGTGSALLSVAHFYAGGVLNSPAIDQTNIVVQVDSA
ncbi:hypothetical protein DICSQDRAFT_174704 [Dichomitus squalens LYAD-421 SS1]|uniref:Uncharacterized protein n=1 Tax=Dichomitus squalens (strain LYAD-421) TaxID=732165 RepID=R7SLS4_DICSQ|nr:uncharacterized protein DICSQDRAFT_174704 [Dichomitus squalens LYAD-421 SS1]EJF56660.1 hypothetical protein DICSQDRAFT_174704 [Dichomitus squalens LYAD-421 SS1]